MSRCTTATSERCRPLHKIKIFHERKSKSPKRRVPVTALMAWPRLDSVRAEPKGANQMAASAETRTPNMHRAKRIAPRECGWKHGDSGDSAGEKTVINKNQAESS